MGVIYDSEVSGSGVFDNGEQFEIDHMSITVLTEGYNTSTPVPLAPDYMIRVGFVSIGYPLDEGSGAFDFWGEPKFIYWEHSLIADYTENERFGWKVRWEIQQGGLVHLVVYQRS